MALRNFFNFALSLTIIFSIVFLVPVLYDIFVTFSLAIMGIALAEWLMTCTRKHFLYKRVSPYNKAVIITGCDTGFGNKAARRMDALGYKVFAGCLFPTGTGAKGLLQDCTKNLSVVPMDVTKDESIQEAKDFVVKNLENNVLWAIVNNAGIGHAGEIDWTSFEEFQKVYDVNAAGVLRVTKAFLPLVKKSRGRIVNNTSIACQFICPGYIGYCMSKCAAVALTTGLRIELAKWGVKAISIEPFFYATPLTRTNIVCEMAEKTWQKAPMEIREQYGEHYKDTFKESTAAILSRCSNKISDVIDCFEDAITAEDPLPTYFPSHIPDKIVVKLLLALPSAVRETYQRYFLERGTKPAALMHEKNNN